MDIYIKQAAKRHGMTMREVATRAGYSSIPSFSRSINTPESMTIKRLQHIASAIGCDVLEFFMPPAEQDEQKEPSQLCPWCGKPIRVQLEQGK